MSIKCIEIVKPNSGKVLDTRSLDLSLEIFGSSEFLKVFNTDSNFCCSLSGNLVVKPIMCGGSVFEKSVLFKWLEKHPYHPITEEPVNKLDLRVSKWKMAETMVYRENVSKSCIDQVNLLMGMEKINFSEERKRKIENMIVKLIDRSFEMKPTCPETIRTGTEFYKTVFDRLEPTGDEILQGFVRFSRFLLSLPKETKDDVLLLLVKHCELTHTRIPLGCHSEICQLLFQKGEYEKCYQILLKGTFDENSKSLFSRKRMISKIEKFLPCFQDKGQFEICLKLAVQLAFLLGKNKKGYKKELSVMKYAMKIGQKLKKKKPYQPYVELVFFEAQKEYLKSRLSKKIWKLNLVKAKKEEEKELNKEKKRQKYQKLMRNITINMTQKRK